MTIKTKKHICITLALLLFLLMLGIVVAWIWVLSLWEKGPL